MLEPANNLFEIIHEDAELLVINKPAGLVCHPSKNGELSSLIGRVRLQRLLDAFGDEYRRYLKRVPMLIPFWPVRP